jgi:hypothetical protein
MRIGSALLAVSALGMLAAPITIVTAIPDLTTRTSRHALAGALGLTALAFLEFLLAIIPIRRGEDAVRRQRFCAEIRGHLPLEWLSG